MTTTTTTYLYDLDTRHKVTARDLQISQEAYDATMAYRREMGCEYKIVIGGRRLGLGRAE